MFDENEEYTLAFILLGLLIGSILMLSINNNFALNCKKILWGGIRGVLVTGGLLAGALYADNYLRQDEKLYLVLFGVAGATISILTWNMLNQTRRDLKKEKLNNFSIYSILTMIVFLGCSITASLFSHSDSRYSLIRSFMVGGFERGFNGFSEIHLLQVGISSIVLLGLVSYHSFKSFTFLKKYRRSKPKLIKP